MNQYFRIILAILPLGMGFGLLCAAALVGDQGYEWGYSLAVGGAVGGGCWLVTAGIVAIFWED